MSGYLFFDTETTGLPKDWRAPLTAFDNWPRMVQLAWMLCDNVGNTLGSACQLIKPEGYVIPPEAAAVHGITTEKALAEGISMADALTMFGVAVGMAERVIAHNISFDEKIICAEFLRRGLPLPFAGKTMVCTMHGSTAYCALPGKYGKRKWPTLTELYEKLFGRKFEGAHDALADVGACKQAYFELRTRKVMT